MFGRLQPSQEMPEERPYIELCLMVDDKVFGIFFINLDDAERAALEVGKTGHRVEIFEKQSGRVIKTLQPNQAI